MEFLFVDVALRSAFSQETGCTIGRASDSTENENRGSYLMSNFYTKHVFVCENVRAEGERVSCGRSGSIQLLASLKKKMKDLSVEGKVRIQRAGCLDRCELGPVQVSYPEGRWFSLKTEEDVDIFLKYYIQSEQIEKIEHLIIKENL